MTPETPCPNVTPETPRGIGASAFVGGFLIERLPRAGGGFQAAEVVVGMTIRRSAHLERGAERGADGRPAGLPEQLAEPAVGQLDAPNAGRFAAGHAGNG